MSQLIKCSVCHEYFDPAYYKEVWKGGRQGLLGGHKCGDCVTKAQAEWKLKWDAEQTEKRAISKQTLDSFRAQRQEASQRKREEEEQARLAYKLDADDVYYALTKPVTLESLCNDLNLHFSEQMTTDLGDVEFTVDKVSELPPFAQENMELAEPHAALIIQYKTYQKKPHGGFFVVLQNNGLLMTSPFYATQNSDGTSAKPTINVGSIKALVSKNDMVLSDFIDHMCNLHYFVFNSVREYALDESAKPEAPKTPLTIPGLEPALLFDVQKKGDSTYLNEPLDKREIAVKTGKLMLTLTVATLAILTAGLIGLVQLGNKPEAEDTVGALKDCDQVFELAKANLIQINGDDYHSKIIGHTCSDLNNDGQTEVIVNVSGLFMKSSLPASFVFEKSGDTIREVLSGTVAAKLMILGSKTSGWSDIEITPEDEDGNPANSPIIYSWDGAEYKVPSLALTQANSDKDISFKTSMYISTEEANVRSEASLKSDVLSVVSLNMLVMDSGVRKQADKINWAYVQIAENTPGWISDKYLSEEPTQESPDTVSTQASNQSQKNEESEGILSATDACFQWKEATPEVRLNSVYRISSLFKGDREENTRQLESCVNESVNSNTGSDVNCEWGFYLALCQRALGVEKLSD